MVVMNSFFLKNRNVTFVAVALLILMGMLGTSLPLKEPSVRVKRVKMVTRGTKNHFFGYYGINVWNKARTHILALETSFNDRLPKQGETATIGLVNLNTSVFEPLTTTNAWNQQQGCMLAWNPQKPNAEFYFNDVVDGQLVSVKYNIRKKRRTVLPYPLSGLSHDGRYAVSMSYGRISRLRKVVSYPGTVDPNPGEAHPANDGIYVVDLETGNRKLIVSFKRMADTIRKRTPEIDDRPMWVEHAEFSRSGKRILFLPRTWRPNSRDLETGLFTVNPDGTDLRVVVPYGGDVSHFGWRNDEEIILSYRFTPKSRQHVMVNNAGRPFIPFNNLMWDGHCSFTGDGKWILTDGNKTSNPPANSVWLVHATSQADFQLHTFDMAESRFLSGDARCDLHPRISDDNRMVCVDAIDPETHLRQIFMIDLVFH